MGDYVTLTGALETRGWELGLSSTVANPSWTPGRVDLDTTREMLFLLKNEFIADLKQEVSDLRGKVGMQGKMIASQGKLITELQAAVFSSKSQPGAEPKESTELKAPEPDDFEKWITSEEIKRQYGGQFIACTGPGKIVDHDESSAELHKRIASYPNKWELIVDKVPRASG